jgi:hypothetical protein
VDEALDDLREKKPYRISYQEFVGLVPNFSPVISDALNSTEEGLSLSHRAARKVAVLTKDDFDTDADKTFKQLIAVMDSDDIYDWVFSFSPTEPTEKK